ncbi:MAG: hypothetical protein JWM33_1701 [Caulobacteraceae bacterium]|nr:hypothetical protein [Caulobacteraceae bacterium]
MSTQILVAVGDPSRREPIVLSLGMAGFLIRTAGSGLEAVRQLERGAGALVLDIDIPGRTCLEVLDWMHRTGRTGRVPVLLVAAHPRLDVLRGAAELGVRGCIRAPVNSAELVSRMSHLLSPESRQPRLGDAGKNWRLTAVSIRRKGPEICALAEIAATS